VVKLGARANDLLSTVGALLDTFAAQQFNLLNAVCTTLNANAFNDTETDSKRPVAWAPLPALPQKPAERMLRRALLQRMLPPRRAVRIAISDCAGHPRSLEYVMKASVETEQCANPKAWRADPDDGRLLDSLRNTVVKRLTRAHTWAVRAALEGRRRRSQPGRTCAVCA